jgi:hypothetical protein
MGFTPAQIDAMSASEYAANLRDPEFIKAVDAMSTPAPILDPETGLPIAAPVAPNEEIPPVQPPVPEVPPTPPTPSAVAEQRYEWQPTDANGKPLGGKQVIIYKTQEELIQKFQEQNTLILRQMRKLSNDVKLGLTPDVDVPATAKRLPKNFDGFKPKTLTADERFQLTQDLNDPEKFEDAKIRLAEATFGATPETISEVLSHSQQLLLEQQVVRSFDEFIENVGDSFYNSPENRATLTDWMCQRQLAPTTANFEIALARTAALQIPAPAVQRAQVTVEQEPKPQVPAVAVSGITDAPPQVQNARRQIPSGLNDRVSSNNGVETVSERKLTLAMVDNMTADEYKKRVQSDPTFLTTVDQLQKEADLRRAARQRQS